MNWEKIKCSKLGEFSNGSKSPSQQKLGGVTFITRKLFYCFINNIQANISKIITITVMVCGLFIFAYTITLHIGIIHSYISCYYTGVCFMYILFMAVFVTILWVGYIYSKKMEALLDKIENKSRNTHLTEDTWLLEKNTSTRKSYTMVCLVGLALVHGVEAIVHPFQNV